MEECRWKIRTEKDKTLKFAPNIRTEKEVIQCLMEDQSVKFVPAEKGNCTFIINKSDFGKRVNDILQKEKYCEVSEDPTPKIQNTI